MTFATLREPCGIRGIGLHTGCSVTATLHPSPELGITFRRTDLPGHPTVAASLSNVGSTVHATRLEQNGVSVSTTEHLLAALWSQGITHCLVELDGPEVPILDGSAAPWLEALTEAGFVVLPGERPVYRLTEPVWFGQGSAHVLGVPFSGFRLTAAVEFETRQGGPQEVDLEVTADSFSSQLAAARTFALESWLGPLQDAGLIRGGSEENAVVIREDGPAPLWRMDKEMVRHKALDAVGDLALLLAPHGALFHGHLVAVRAGHGLHRGWMDAAIQRNSLTLE